MSTDAPIVKLPKRRWFQFSLRTLMIFVTLCGLVCGWGAFVRNKARRQQALVENLTRVAPDPNEFLRLLARHERLEFPRVIYDYESAYARYVRPHTSNPPGPLWLRQLLGNDAFQDVYWLDVEVQPDTRLKDMGELPKLKTLNLSGELTDAKFDELPELKSVESLWLRSVASTGAGLANLRKFPNLEYLEILFAIGSGDDLAPLQNMTRLRSLKLSSISITDDGLGYLQGLARLARLDAAAPNVTNKGLSHLKGLTNLEWLALYFTKVTDAGTKNLRDLTHLKGLFLADTQITDAGLDFLDGLPQLEQLDLGGAQITDEGMKHFHGLTHLKKLNLQQTKITAEGAQSLRRALPTCEIRVFDSDPAFPFDSLPLLQPSP